MTELRCPHCGRNFQVDDGELTEIVGQLRDKTFEKEVEKRLQELTRNLEEKHRLEMENIQAKIRMETGLERDKALSDLKNSYENAAEKLKKEQEKALEEVRNGLTAEREKVSELRSKLESADSRQELAVLKARQAAGEEKQELERALSGQKEKYEILLNEKEKEVELYKDLKTRMSTKMVGETLEQHCETEFNRLRATAFPGVYFEKDNNARSGSKGDYIYREVDEDGVELISIMFEMKNETDSTSTKHKNEDFFRELDRDRREKNCEYAVLVSLLEPDSDLYNAGIVDVSYRYKKMYVVRPQCFIPVITILRNSAGNAMEYKRELRRMREQDIDVSHFEESLLSFKDAFGRNYQLAHEHFDKAVDEIDKTIQHLEKVKKELLGSDNQLRIANSKVEDISIKKLTRDNPTMQARFRELEEQ